MIWQLEWRGSRILLLDRVERRKDIATRVERKHDLAARVERKQDLAARV